MHIFTERASGGVETAASTRHCWFLCRPRGVFLVGKDSGELVPVGRIDRVVLRSRLNPYQTIPWTAFVHRARIVVDNNIIVQAKANALLSLAIRRLVRRFHTCDTNASSASEGRTQWFISHLTCPSARCCPFLSALMY